MKDYLRELLAAAPGALSGRLVVREYLQARLLELLQDVGAFGTIAFLGGTALRFLYRLPRFSEDLDFSTIQPGQEPDLARWAAKVASRLGQEGYRLETRVRKGAVASMDLRFIDLYDDLGLVAQRGEKLMIRMEVGTNPPAGADLTNTLVRRHVLLNLRHHDRASLLAGKLHAILTRRYTKGRDLFDLAWYLSDSNWPAPNLVLLRNALAQTGWTGGEVSQGGWRSLVARRVADMDWGAVLQDVQPFLESASVPFGREQLEDLLARR